MPTSVLWIGLIVIWLFVLVPMMVTRRPKVKSISDGALRTRVLHRGGTSKLIPKRRIAPSAPADDYDYDPITEEFPAIDVAVVKKSERNKADTKVVMQAMTAGELLEHAQQDSVVLVEDSELEDAHAYVDFDVDPEDEVLEDEVVGGEIAEEDVVEEDLDDDEVIEDEVAGEAAESDVEESEAADDSPAEDSPAEPAETAPAEPEPELAESEAERAAEEVPVVARRRGGFDPEADARIAETRYRFRQRVTFGLGIAAIVMLGLSVFGVSVAWYGLGAVLVGLVGYLGYLRRTVSLETEIRRRRVARLARAQRERERENEMVDGVPARLRRHGGIVLEADDDDPAFDHLPTYQGTLHEEFDDHHAEPLRRAVS